jgi:LacI family transcriptional regulator
MNVRLKDIADKLGVSVVTVSRALRDRPNIASETKARILNLVKELNYQTNHAARSLATGRSSLIGFVVPDLIHPFFGEIAKGLSSALRETAYYVIVASSENDPGLEQDEIGYMLARNLDCLVLASCQENSESLRRIGDAGVPLVLIDRKFHGFDSNFVGVNDYQVGELATEHLIAQGCRCIAHIRGPANSVGNNRADGYRDTLQRHGISVSDDYMISTGDASESDGQTRGRQAMETILTLKPRPDGLFCFNDAIAVGAMFKAFEAGMSIPKDLALVGSGNFHYSDKLRVPLTSVDQRAVQIGERAARMIGHLLEKGSSIRSRKVVLEPQLIVRASSQLMCAGGPGRTIAPAALKKPNTLAGILTAGIGPNSWHVAKVQVPPAPEP